MGVVKRIVGAVVVLLSALGFLAGLAGVAGVWAARQYLDGGAVRVFARVESALEVARRGARQVNDVLDKSEASLRQLKDAPAAAIDDPAKRLALRLAASQLTSDSSSQEVRDNLTAVAQAAVVANTVLENVGNLPLEPGTDLNAEGVRDLSARLTEAASLARQLDAMLDDGAATPEAVRDRTSRIDAALTAVHAVTSEFEARVGRFSEREQEWKVRVFMWLNVGAVVATVLFLWFVLSQVSLLLHGWSWLWKRPSSA